MKSKIPLPVWIVSILFIAVGCMGFAYHFKDLNSNDNKSEVIWVLFLRILAVICGLLLLYRQSWARWLAIAWLVYHIVIGALNSIPEILVHIGFLIVVTILLFLPVSAKYFNGKKFWKDETNLILK